MNLTNWNLLRLTILKKIVDSSIIFYTLTDTLNTICIRFLRFKKIGKILLKLEFEDEKKNMCRLKIKMPLFWRRGLLWVTTSGLRTVCGICSEECQDPSSAARCKSSSSELRKYFQDIWERNQRRNQLFRCCYSMTRIN